MNVHKNSYGWGLFMSPFPSISHKKPAALRERSGREKWQADAGAATIGLRENRNPEEAVNGDARCAKKIAAVRFSRRRLFATRTTLLGGAARSRANASCV